MTLKALTVHQPWAELIIRGRKDVENRSRRTNHRGLLAIHAGKQLDPHRPAVRGGLEHSMEIIGVVKVVDCVWASGSPWGLRGYWHWLLSEPRRLEKPIPIPGHQSLWIVPPGIERNIRRQIKDAPVKRGHRLPVVKPVKPRR